MVAFYRSRRTSRSISRLDNMIKKRFNKQFWLDLYLSLTDQYNEYYLSKYNKELEKQIDMLEGILVQAAWLYGKTRYIEKNLTTEEKEFLADVLERRVGRDDNEPYTHDRWWRE